LRQHKGIQVGNANTGRPCAKEQNTLVGWLRTEHSYGCKHTSNTYAGCALNVVVKTANAMAVSF